MHIQYTNTHTHIYSCTKVDHIDDRFVVIVVDYDDVVDGDVDDAAGGGDGVQRVSLEKRIFFERNETISFVRCLSYDDEWCDRPTESKTQTLCDGKLAYTNTPEYSTRRRRRSRENAG